MGATGLVNKVDRLINAGTCSGYILDLNCPQAVTTDSGPLAEVSSRICPRVQSNLTLMTNMDNLAALSSSHVNVGMGQRNFSGRHSLTKTASLGVSLKAPEFREEPHDLGMGRCGFCGYSRAAIRVALTEYRVSENEASSVFSSLGSLKTLSFLPVILFFCSV